MGEEKKCALCGKPCSKTEMWAGGYVIFAHEECARIGDEAIARFFKMIAYHPNGTNILAEQLLHARGAKFDLHDLFKKTKDWELLVELTAITQCPYCTAERKTGKGMYFHLIEKHGLNAPADYEATYHSGKWELLALTRAQYRDLLHYHPARDSLGVLLTIQDEQAPSRGTFQYPDDGQDHVCKLSGYCNVHKTSHDHVKAPNKKRRL